jgi:hypothetical protein
MAHVEGWAGGGGLLMAHVEGGGGGLLMAHLMHAAQYYRGGLQAAIDQCSSRALSINGAAVQAHNWHT